MKKPILSLMILLVLVLSSLSLAATSYTWNGGAGNWNDPGMWTPNGVPGASDDATVNSGMITLTGVTNVHDLLLKGTITGAFDLFIHGSFTLLEHGYVDNVQDILVEGDMSWVAGTIAEPGTMTVNGLISITTQGSNMDHFLFSRTLIAAGGVTHTGGRIRMGLAATFIVSEGAVYLGNSPHEMGIEDGPKSTGNSVVIEGTFQRTITGTFVLGPIVAFHNYGSVLMNAGALGLNGGGDQTGTFHLDAGTEMTFGNSAKTYNLDGAEFSGTGTVRQTGPSVLLWSGSGNFYSYHFLGGAFLSFIDIHVASDMIIRGNLFGPFDLTVDGNLTLEDDSYGIIHNDFTVTVGGNFSWKAGRVGYATDGGTMTVNGLTTISTNANKFLEKVHLIANGGVSHQDGNVQFGFNGTLTVPADATYTANSPDGKGLINGPGTIHNAGLFQRTVTGNFITGGSIPFNNSGTIQPDMGSISVHGTLTNTGALKGHGLININGAFTNSGSVEPGSSPGILTINNGQPLSATSTLLIEMNGGAGPGNTNGHDQLKRAGNLSLNGELTVTETATIPGGLYTIVQLTSGVISGTFSEINLPPFTFLENITATEVILRKENPTITCPADVTIETNPGECFAVVNGVDPIVTPSGTDYTYTLTGATSGTGTGSASGLSYNVGITTITYAITEAPGITCEFNVTVVSGSDEICNGLDDDCDGLVDDADPDVTDQSIWYADSDGDLFGDPDNSLLACDQPEGYVSDNTDCDDLDAAVNPDADEVCNDIDDDCDGLIDDADPGVADQSTWYADADGDGYGSSTSSVISCDQPAGYVANDDDCNDADADVNPSATEVCNTVDDDCDGLVDDLDPSVVGQTSWYADTDNDGFGASSGSVISCAQPDGYVANEDDCDDTNPLVNPSAVESCNEIDDDCDGEVDEGLIDIQFSDCPDNVDTDVEPGQWGAHVSWTPPTAFSACGISALISDYAPGDFFNVGSTIVTYVATTSVGNTGTCSFIVTVNPPEILGDVNISIFANDIQFSDPLPDPGTFITLSATVHNNSNEDASAFVVHLLDQYSEIAYPDASVSFLGANQSLTINWVIETPLDPAFVPMQVSIDFLNEIEESNELDNQAIRPFINGAFTLDGQIEVTANANPGSTVAGSVLHICGNAIYTGTAIELPDPSVAGAQVTILIAETGQQLSGVTNSNGDFCIPYSTSNTPGVFHFSVEVTDFTLSGEASGLFELMPPVVICPTDLSLTMELYGDLLCGHQYRIAEGSALTGVVYVRNSCEAISVATSLLIVAPGASPVPGPFAIPPLAPGEIYEVILPLMYFNTTGATYISAIVDYQDILAEDIETNNTRTFTIHVHPPMPDITPTWAGASIAYECETGVVNVRVESRGGEPTGVFNAVLEIYFGATLEATVSQIVASIPAQCETYITFPFDPLNAGEYLFTLYLDAQPSQITEISETNNTYSFGRFIQQCNTDLIVYGCGLVDVKPADPDYPGSITLQATIGNQGLLPVMDPFEVHFDIDGTVYPVTINEVLPANGSLTTSVSVPTPPFGVNTLIVTADAANDIAEQQEGNNGNSELLCWDFEPINYKCHELFPFPVVQYVCDPIQLGIRVFNFGLYEATTVQVKFELNGPGFADWLDLGYATTFMDVTCGCPQYVSLQSGYHFPQTGSYSIRITADFDGLYTECDETNNQLIIPFTVVENPDYAVYSEFIAPSELNPDINEPISVNLTYRNEGCSGVTPIELYMDVDNTPHDSVEVDPLISGAQATHAISQTWSSGLPGVHVIRSIIDHDNEVGENNELNNEATRTIVVGGAPNFNLFDLTASEMSPDVGQSISLDAAITNEGEATGTGMLRFFFVNAQNDEVLIDQQSIQLAHNETTIRSITWIVSDPYARIVARVSEVDPVEYDFTDNEQELQLNSLEIQVITTDVACSGLETGTAEVVITGGQEPFFIQWSSGHNDPAIQVPAGVYSVTVTMLNAVYATDLDTITDLALPTTWYLDADGDGFGNPDVSVYTCEPPLQYVGTGTDCDDANSSSYPEAMEVADGVDNDCDGLIDEGFSSLSVDAGDCESVYLGFEPEECIELIVNVNGGTTPYTYLWSNGSVGPATTVCPDETTIYTIVVTDNNGFSAQDVVTVQVIDVRCGNNLDKVNVCHIPPGNPENAHTICISPNALDTHLDEHGDYLGVCGAVDPCIGEVEGLQIENDQDHAAFEIMEPLLAISEGVTDTHPMHVKPNPADSYVEIRFLDTQKFPKIRLFDATGKLLNAYDVVSGKVIVPTEELEDGIYYLQAVGFELVITKEVVIVHQR